MTKLHRYVLFHRSKEPPAADLTLLESEPAVSIIDRTANRAFLVEATQEAINQIRERLPDWIIENEVVHEAPGVDRGRKT